MTAPVGTLFRPAARCGAACLRPAERADQLLAVVRATAALSILVAAGIAGVAIGALPVARRPRSARVLLRAAARLLLRALGVRVVRTGAPMPSRRALIVANHVSWLDILALLASADTFMLAKADVATWPMVGRLARLSGAIFIDRDRPRSLPGTVARIRDTLAAGQVVTAFPEGTTSCGTHPVRYRPAVFQAAIDAKVPVVPIVLRYTTGAGLPTARPAFIGDETLVTSLRRVLVMSSIRLDIEVGAPVTAPHSCCASRDRAALSRMIQSFRGGQGDNRIP